MAPGEGRVNSVMHYAIDGEVLQAAMKRHQRQAIFKEAHCQVR